MSSGQWRVTILLLVLLGMELLRSQTVRGFFKASLVNPLKQGSAT
jgi:hypothetical protein